MRRCIKSLYSMKTDKNVYSLTHSLAFLYLKFEDLKMNFMKMMMCLCYGALYHSFPPCRIT